MIILIPGIGGSKLYCGCHPEKRLIYPKKFYKIFQNLDEEFFNKDCKVITEPLISYYGISIYKKIIQRLNGFKGHETYVHHYDWRRPCHELARELTEKLNTIKEPMILIGHSNGGILIRVAFEYMNYSNGLVNQIFICGSPLLGSINFDEYNSEFQLAKNLKDPNSSLGKIKPMMLTNNDYRRILTDFKTTLEFLIPSPILMAEMTGFNIPKIVHCRLQNRRRWARYFFIFNVHKQQKIMRINRQEELIFGKYKMHPTDSLIVPMIEIENNIHVFYDHTPCPHFALLNSRDVTLFIKSRLEVVRE